MTTPNQAWFATVMVLIRPWIEPPQRSPFSKKEMKLIRFRLALTKCSDDQKLLVMTLMMTISPVISNIPVEVCEAYYNANRSSFLREWQFKIRELEASMFSCFYKSYTFQLRCLFLQMEPTLRSGLVHQMLLTSPLSIMKKLETIYNYRVLFLYNTQESQIACPVHSQEINKHRLVFVLNNSPSMQNRRIFFLHQQLEKQMVMHCQQMLQQLYLDIDMELENLSQERSLSLEERAMATEYLDNNDEDFDYNENTEDDEVSG